ncbi:response regulator transcription factor [Variovorax sp. KK3]|uniref:response regulator transcription factor n=1 Tax=Variovorax sp. KK3 TaxID=1855728 RepID=UPI00097CADDB|nr:response regulator transcription factor [Variovorax sp. KK3]
MNDVLIVEDHPFVAHATKELISHNYPLLQISVRSSATAVRSALSDPTKVWHRILLDLDVPGAHGLSLATELRDRGLAGITCVVTAMHRQDFVAQAKAMGFLGYIIKATPVDAFASALDQIFRGERCFAAAPPVDRMRDETTLRITRRQAQVLDLVRSGFSSKEIGRALGLSEGTVNNHINAAMAALNVKTRSHAVTKAIEGGMLSQAPGPHPEATRLGAQ